NNSNTFVHKLHEMVNDEHYQHLITWNASGSSFVVCDTNRLSQEVLPKHFKHGNFQSFVRQLNMYGFHKINKSPRGQRPAAENQIWEFSHPRFIRGHPELLDEIKRKAIDTDSTRRETGDLYASVALVQNQQSTMTQQIKQLLTNYGAVVRELTDVKQHLNVQMAAHRKLVDHL
ncbi:hypothetical protein BJ085DRAFT_5787, partial [Dimargaris cristalligena]